jgi:hypothetical protein
MRRFHCVLLSSVMLLLTASTASALPTLSMHIDDATGLDATWVAKGEGNEFNDLIHYSRFRSAIRFPASQGPRPLRASAFGSGSPCHPVIRRHIAVCLLASRRLPHCWELAPQYAEASLLCDATVCGSVVAVRRHSMRKRRCCATPQGIANANRTATRILGESG